MTARRKYWLRVIKHLEHPSGRRYHVDDRLGFKTKTAALQWSEKYTGYFELVPNDQVMGWWK